MQSGFQKFHTKKQTNKHPPARANLYSKNLDSVRTGSSHKNRGYQTNQIHYSETKPLCYLQQLRKSLIETRSILQSLLGTSWL